jgi:hypothetical protein
MYVQALFSSEEVACYVYQKYAPIDQAHRVTKFTIGRIQSFR